MKGRMRPSVVGWLFIFATMAAIIWFMVVPILRPYWNKLVNPPIEPTTVVIQVPATATLEIYVEKPSDTPIPWSVATATPVSATPTARIIPTGKATAPVLAATATTEASVVPTLVPTVQPPAKLPTLKVAFDSFGSYFPVMQIAQDPNREVDLELIAFGFNGRNYTENQRAQMISNGEWDILLTTADSLAKKGNIGKIVCIIDQSAGADKIVAWPNSVTQPGQTVRSFNDLKGKVITFSEGSVGQYQVLALLRVVLLTPQDVTFLPAGSVSEAVGLFVDGKADAVAGWEPDISLTLEVGGIELVSTSWWRNVSDVIVVSHQANQSKKPEILSFLRAWLQALKLQQENLPLAAEQIASLQIDGLETNDWSYVYPGSAADDLILWLETIAQAGLGENVVMMRSPQLLADQLSSSRDVWAWGNLAEGSFNANDLIEPSYILQLGQDQALYPNLGSQFVNASFQATSPKLPQADPNVLVNLPAIAMLPITRVDFEANSSQIRQSDLDAITTAARAMIEMTRVSDVQILITGSSAWPARYQEEDIWAMARERAVAVQLALVKGGLDPSRITTIEEIPPPQHQKTTVEEEMAPYRRVLIEARRGGR